MSAALSPVPASSITTWDDEADVVIVGSDICHAENPVAAARTMHGFLYR